MKFLKKMLSNQAVLYIIVGFLTTVLNIFLFHSFNKLLNESVTNQYNFLYANAAAWVIATLFAFICDKVIVFKSVNFFPVVFLKEMFSFYSLRALSFFVEEFGMYCFVMKFNFDKIFSKILISVVVVILNFLFSKFVIFNKKS